MQYKCMERQSRNLSMEGFHFPFCYAHREYSGRNAALAEGNKGSLYTDFLLPLSGSPGAWEAKRILQNKLKQDNIKNTDTIPCSMSPHSRTTRAGLTQDFPTVQRCRLILRGPQYCLARICIRVFVLSSFHTQKRYEEMIDISSCLFSTVKTPDSSHADARQGSGVLFR